MSTSRLSPAVVNGIVDAVLRDGDIWPFEDSLYLALLTSAPYRDEESGYYDYIYFQPEQEVAYTGYARRLIPRTLAGWVSTQGDLGASTGTSGTTRPAANQFFPLCTTSSQVVTHVAVTDTSSLNSDRYPAIAWWELDRPMRLSNSAPGFYPCLNASALTIRLDT